MKGHGFGRRPRATACHDVRKVHDLECLDGADQQNRHRHRHDLRPGHLAENMKARGAVDLRRLDMVARHIFQRRQHADEDEGNPLPGITDHHHETGRPGACRPHPVLQPQKAENGFERAFRDIGDHPHRKTDAKRCHHQRNEEQDAEEIPAPDRLRTQERKPGADHKLHPAADKDIEQGGIKGADGIARQERGAEKPAQENRHGGGDRAAKHAHPGGRLPGFVEPPENGHHDRHEDNRAENTDRFGAAKEMDLAAAEELFLEIAKSDIAEFQPVAGKAHAAEREYHRIDGRENGENQNEGDRGGNEECARMAVNPFTPAVA